MHIENLGSYEAMSARATDLLAAVVRANPLAHLILATGGSPEGLYAGLAGKGLDLSGLWITKLDEWLGLPMDHPGSGEVYLRRHVLSPWGVRADRYLGFDGMADDPAAECERVARELHRRPPVDAVVLGIGVNGHLALNEPGAWLHAGPHVATLASTSRTHAMLEGLAEPPTQGLTMGVGTLLNSALALLLVAGSGKEQALDSLRSGLVSTSSPATFLHLHRNAHCLVAW